MTTTKRLLAIPGGAGSARGRERHFLESTGKFRQSSKLSRSDHDVSSMQKARIELTTCIHEFSTIRIYELFDQYFSVDEGNKFLDGHKRIFFLSFEHLIRTSKKYYIINLFVTSKNETTNYPIHEFKVLHKGQRAF